MESNVVAGVVAGVAANAAANAAAGTAAGAAEGKIQVDEALSAFASLMRDTARVWSTEARQAQATSIQTGVATPVANCAAAAAVSQSARTTAAAFSTAAGVAQSNDKNFTDFLRRYAGATAELAGGHGLRVSSSDYSFQV